MSSFSRADARDINSIVISQGNVESILFKLIARRVLVKAYNKIGKRVTFDAFPEQRSVVVANSGVTDGELVRIGGLQAKYPNLIQIPVLIAKNEILAFSKFSDFEIKGWQSLQGYYVSFPFGIQISELKAEGMITESVTSIDQGLIKLNAGRSDFFIGTIGFHCSIKKLNLTDIKVLSPPIDTVNMFHYLHKRHHELANQLEIVLRQMKNNGEMALIQTQAKRDFFKQCKEIQIKN